MNKRDLINALNQLPKELDATYDEAISRINDQSDERKELGLRVLMWVTTTFRPLSIAELQCALAVKLGDTNFDEDGITEVDLLISVCGGLVSVDRHSKEVRLIRESKVLLVI